MNDYLLFGAMKNNLDQVMRALEEGAHVNMMGKVGSVYTLIKV